MRKEAFYALCTRLLTLLKSILYTAKGAILRGNTGLLIKPSRRKAGLIHQNDLHSWIIASSSGRSL